MEEGWGARVGFAVGKGPSIGMLRVGLGPSLVLLSKVGVGGDKLYSLAHGKAKTSLN